MLTQASREASLCLNTGNAISLNVMQVENFLSLEVLVRHRLELKPEMGIE